MVNEHTRGGGAAGHDDVAGDDARWRAAGERIETLLDASAAGGAVARERAEQLVREVVDLYGAGLRRIARLLDGPAMEALAGDDLVASLLLVHGLHPHDVHTRVQAALDRVRPYLGSHGGDVALLGVTDGVVRLELSGSCRSCPSSSVTLELAVDEAVRAAAPEIEEIDVVAAVQDAPHAAVLDSPHAAVPDSSTVISADALFTRVRAGGPAGSWVAVPELAGLAPGEVGGFAVAGQAVLACRLGEDVLVYRDHCPGCENSMAGAVLAADEAVLRCPVCRAHFDIVRAGARLDGPGHLEPLPVLVRDGRLSVAIPVEASLEGRAG
jgi:Fe-S cluster biogenesis protein NfuA/nitrite reductase/ring-hydroxylating ferredoxin subunit